MRNGNWQKDCGPGTKKAQNALDKPLNQRHFLGCETK
jgi:hypothetical protein